MINREKMTPGKWTVDNTERIIGDNGKRLVADCWCAASEDHGKANAQAIVDLHNAWLIQMEMGWGVRKIDDTGNPEYDGKWQAMRNHGGSMVGICSMVLADDPATAILEAYVWWQEHEGQAKKEG